MSSEGNSGIPESPPLLERSKQLTSRKWHNNIMNLLLRKNVCGACLRLENDLVHWDVEFTVVRSENENEISLKNIMISAFGPSVANIISTPNFCQNCTDTILGAHILIVNLRENCRNIQKKLIEITKQMKWTAYLDETGSLADTIINNNKEDYKLITGTANEPIRKEVKTHKIILDNESLKNKLVKDANMHKYLFHQVKETEPTLPAGITVKKVVKDIDNIEMTDFAPQDLLELNWAEDEKEPNELQSNEALIMNLMEEAKTGDKHKHFHDHLNLKVIEPETQTLNDSLSVKLVQNQTENENYSDSEVVPQDLLELKWPDEPNQSDKQQTIIPVKKLNFNESLTVKYIPSHKLLRVYGGPKASQNLAGNCNDKETQDETAQKPSIDLTKWLHDQGMNTIKAKSITDISATQDFDIEDHITKKVKVEMKDPERSNHSGTGLIKNKCSIAVKNLELEEALDLRDPDIDTDAIRCGLCDLKFILFESYQSHYKTHNISDKAKCYKCSGKFPVVELLIEHLLNIHSEHMSYCTICYALLPQTKMAHHVIEYHAKKVQIVNAQSVPLITKDGRCKSCLQTSVGSSHICVFNYECIECKQDCIHERFIKSFIEQIKDNKTVYKCTDCEYMYKTKQDIVKHANYMHLRHLSHQCNVCEMKFGSQNELTKHSASCHYTCMRCKKVFSEKNLNHECHLESDLCCETCGQKFSNPRLLHKHKETASAIRDQCILCHDFVPNICNLSRHMQVKHQVYLKKVNETIFYECTICQQRFDDGIEFRQHKCLYDCHICEKRFINKILYERHLQAHKTGRPKFKCSVCNLELKDKSSLSNHMGTHPEHVTCPICKTYVTKTVLLKHVESHKDAGDLKCPHCVLVCENQNQLEVHVNRFHLMQRPYQCDICSKSFYGKLKLREHIKEHNASHRRTCQCPVCDKSFTRKVYLEKHLKLHTTGQLYNCNLCEKVYISEALLKQHRKSHADDLESKPETSQSGHIYSILFDA